jgi:hypothetical protein
LLVHWVVWRDLHQFHLRRPAPLAELLFGPTAGDNERQLIKSDARLRKPKEAAMIR